MYYTIMMENTIYLFLFANRIGLFKESTVYTSLISDLFLRIQMFEHLSELNQTTLTRLH